MKFTVMSDGKHGQQRSQLWAETASSHYMAFTSQISAYMLCGSTKRAINSLSCDKHCYNDGHQYDIFHKYRQLSGMKQRLIGAVSQSCRWSKNDPPAAVIQRLEAHLLPPFPTADG